MAGQKSQYPVLGKRTLVWENPRFFVFQDEVSWRGQLWAGNYLVVAPKQIATDPSVEIIPRLVTGVAVLPIHEGKIGLIKTYRHAIGDNSWEVPRGFVDEGETEVESALRELEEESGLSCIPDAVYSLGFIAPDAGVLAARIHLFVAAECVRKRPFSPGELGHQEFRLFQPAEIAEMVARSEIQDPSTLVAYFNYFSLVRISSGQEGPLASRIRGYE